MGEVVARALEEEGERGWMVEDRYLVLRAVVADVTFLQSKL